MSHSVLISVIIPAYNTERYLGETLESLLAQTYPHFEVMIVNDGSTDRTLEIAHQYAVKDPRIHVVSQLNQGISLTRNRGIEETTGELIAFLDADDRWVPEKLATHALHFATMPQLGMSFAKVAYISANGSNTGQKSNSKLTNFCHQDFYLENHAITPSNVVIRRSVLKSVGAFNPEFSNGLEDQELFVRLLCFGITVEGLETILTDYRIREESMSANLNKMTQAWQQFNNCVEAYAPDLVQSYSDRAQAYFLRYLARRGLRNHQDTNQIRQFIWQAIEKDWRLLLVEPKRTFSTLLFSYLPI
jgi:glycosyltransferase involved in cell wall biosynthesis